MMIPNNIERALEMTAISSEVQNARLELEEWIREQRFRLPPKPHESIEILCEKLSPSNIVMCLQWLLCEERVLMVSSDVNTLNACSEALLCLLYPLQWKSLYIPVLPRSMLMLTECATPFLFGILEEHLEIITRNQTPRLGIAPTPINLVFLDFDKAVPPMTSDDDQSSDDVHKLPVHISISTTRKLEEAIEERDKMRNTRRARLVRLACLEMMKSLFGAHNDIAILEHRNWFTVTKAFERSKIEPERYRTYWPSSVPKLSKQDIEKADREWIEKHIKNSSVRAFVRTVTENTHMWQAYRSYVVRDTDSEDLRQENLLLGDAERLWCILRQWDIKVFDYFVDRGDTSVVA